MSARSSLADLKADIEDVTEAVGFGSCSSKWLPLVNEAQLKLANAGRWWGTYARTRHCVIQGCITWPANVAVVEAFRVCGQAVPVRNQWYEFNQFVPAPRICPDSADQQWNGWSWGPQLLDRTNDLTVCQHTDYATASTIRIYPAVAADAGKRVLIQGFSDGLPVRTLDDETGNYVDGEYVTLASPFVETTITFDPTRLTGAQKPLTQGRLDVYAVDEDGIETLIAAWGPSELNPSYRRSYVYRRPRNCSSQNQTGNWCFNRPEGCEPSMLCTGHVADAVVRLELVPAVVDSDWLFIGNISALKSAMKSIVLGNRNDQVNSAIEWKSAIKTLRDESQKYGPVEQTSMQIQVPHSPFMFGFR